MTACTVRLSALYAPYRPLLSVLMTLQQQHLGHERMPFLCGTISSPLPVARCRFALQGVPMRTRAIHAATLWYLLTAFPSPAVVQVDQQRAQEFFKEAQAFCARARRWAALGGIDLRGDGDPSPYIRTGVKIVYVNGAGRDELKVLIEPRRNQPAEAEPEGR